MRLKLKRDTQEQIQILFKTVSYHSNSMDRVFNANTGVRKGNEFDSYPYIDLLLMAHWNNNHDKEDSLAKLCENIAKKATNNCDIDIRT